MQRVWQQQHSIKRQAAGFHVGKFNVRRRSRNPKKNAAGRPKSRRRRWRGNFFRLSRVKLDDKLFIYDRRDFIAGRDTGHCT
jgi:hypothetical protein